MHVKSLCMKLKSKSLVGLHISLSNRKRVEGFLHFKLVFETYSSDRRIGLVFRRYFITSAYSTEKALTITTKNIAHIATQIVHRSGVNVVCMEHIHKKNIFSLQNAVFLLVQKFKIAFKINVPDFVYNTYYT
jgi:UDP-2,3-diacylglucosamine pyrophosphatase LpxH